MRAQALRFREHFNTVLRKIRPFEPVWIRLSSPSRYRGYYYDQETGFYYLQSRYYDPQTGRFLSADSVDYLGETKTFLSYNLYAYCEGNPVLFFDNNGQYAIAIGGAMAKFIIGVTIIVIAAIILSDPAVQRALAESIAIMGSNIKTACEAVTRAIESSFKKAKTRTRNTNTALHHIVAKTAKGAEKARYYLKKARFNVNDSINLVRIKQNLHYHLHTAAYYTAVNNLMERANGSKPKTIAVLRFIKQVLQRLSRMTP